MDKSDVKINEESKNLVEQLIPRLALAHQTVDELVKVYKEYGTDYDREKAYTEEIDVQMKEAAQKRQIAAGKLAKAEGAQASTIGGQSDMKTGKLNTSMLTDNIRR